MTRKVCFLILFVLVIRLSVSGQGDMPGTKSVNPSDSGKYFGLFDNDSLLEITLRFDLSKYFREKPKEEYLKANITFHPGTGDSLSEDIRLRTRGEFRNNYCYYAPIELNFKKADLGFDDLDNITKLKMVTQCYSGSKGEDYVLREYLVYKLFSVFTDTSFRVRLLKINYIDTERDRKPISQYGFFIEPVEMLADRAGSIQIKSAVKLNQKSIFPFIIDRVAIFNYMIGNYDWAVPNQHNVRVIKANVIDSIQLAIAVPYDFDWTGFVNADYAVPAEIVGTSNVRQRIFLGVCRNEEIYSRELDYFVGKKEELYGIINDFPYLNPRAKRDLTSYLDEFFNNIMNRKKNLINIFMDTCKKF